MPLLSSAGGVETDIGVLAAERSLPVELALRRGRFLFKSLLFESGRSSAMVGGEVPVSSESDPRA